MTGRLTSTRPAPTADRNGEAYRRILEDRLEANRRLIHALKRAVHRFVELEAARSNRATFHRISVLKQLALDDAHRALS